MWKFYKCTLFVNITTEKVSKFSKCILFVKNRLADEGVKLHTCLLRNCHIRRRMQIGIIKILKGNLRWNIELSVFILILLLKSILT